MLFQMGLNFLRGNQARAFVTALFIDYGHNGFFGFIQHSAPMIIRVSPPKTIPKNIAIKL